MVDYDSVLSLKTTHLMTKHDNLKKMSEYIIPSNINRECTNKRNMVKTLGINPLYAYPFDLFKMILEVPL